MINMLILAVSMFAGSPAKVAAPVSACEWVGPRIDGISVEICAGSVRSMRDQLGNVVVMWEVR